MQSTQSNREICYPNYEELDTTCTDAESKHLDLVAPPIILHGT